MSSPDPDPDYSTLRLQIGPVVRQAEKIAERVRRDMPQHDGLAALASGVATVAREAQRVSEQLRRPFGLHRLPALFLAVALAGLAWGIYFQFLHVSRLRIAVSSRDAIELKSHLDRRVHFEMRPTEGSVESLKLLERGEVDLAFVQGGVEMEREGGERWLVREIPGQELVLFFLRGSPDVTKVRRILTSTQDQGSHALARVFLRCWGLEDKAGFVHEWQSLLTDPGYAIPADVDAVLVVKDPLSPQIPAAARKLSAAGFQMVSPYLGAHALRLPYLHDTTLHAGFVDPVTPIPSKDLPTYSVSTYLVVNPKLSHRQLAAADSLLERQVTAAPLTSFDPSTSNASEILQGMEAGLGVLVYVGLAFLALLGLDVYAYQSRFNELNSLVSLISIHQSSRDAIAGTPEKRAADVAYLRVCSDLLGLISVVTGYYTQENASLMYNRLLDVIHERSSSLKINIQLKILHAMIDLPQQPGDPPA